MQRLGGIHGHARRRGSAIVFAVFAVLISAGMIASMMMISMASNREADVDRDVVRSRYLAEGVLEVAKKDIQTAVANWEPVPAKGTVSYQGRDVVYTVVPTGLDTIVTDPSGIQELVTGYEVFADARVGFARSRAHRLINVEATPIFQFAVFYASDLEVFPGPNMTLGGRVHSNGDLYIGCGGTLTVDTNYMRAVGDIRRNRKDNPSASTGSVTVRRWVEDPYDPTSPVEFFKLFSKGQLDSLGISSVSGYDSEFELGYDSNADGDFWDENDLLPWGPGALEYTKPPELYVGGTGSTIMSAQQGVTEAVTLSVGSVAMFDEVEGGEGSYVYDDDLGEYVEVMSGGTHDKGYYHGEADLTLVLQSDGTLLAYDSAGINVTLGVGDAAVVGDIYDARQANGSSDKVNVIEVDVAKLNASVLFPANGLLYAAVAKPGEGTDCGGIVLKNGAELSGALTVVSQNSVYVQGDYNTVDKKGAAVIADAVNLLSNAWNDSKVKGSGLPVASDTTFNLAVITGNHDTVGSSYNGGLENLPRFHEKWSSKACNLTGSLVNTWTSTYATGPWKYGGDRYAAPIRNWAYDESFNNVANLPPYTPMAVSARDVASW